MFLCLFLVREYTFQLIKKDATRMIARAKNANIGLFFILCNMHNVKLLRCAIYHFITHFNKSTHLDIHGDLLERVPQKVSEHRAGV